MNDFDVAIIGSGPGGYVAAIRSAQLGMKTALVEKYDTLGGTCLNVGCIPSKSLLDSSHHYEDAIKHFSEHGIEFDGKIKVNFKQMIDRKTEVVNQTTKGINYLMEKNNCNYSFTSDGSRYPKLGLYGPRRSSAQLERRFFLLIFSIFLP